MSPECRITDLQRHCPKHPDQGHQKPFFDLHTLDHLGHCILFHLHETNHVTCNNKNNKISLRTNIIDASSGVTTLKEYIRRLTLLILGNERGEASDSISQSNQIWFPLFSVHRT